MQRAELIASLVEALSRRHGGGPTRVAITGIDTAGKTTLADELARALTAIGRPRVRASIDHFYRPGHIHRAAAGAYTPRSYYDEAFDFTVFLTDFLGPLGPGGDHRVRLASWQMWPDLPASDARVAVDAEAIALVDGVFLLRPELRPHWDLVVWLEVRVDLALVRALERDIALAGSAEAVCARYEHRNFPAHDLYVHDTGGAAAADIVIDNSDPQRPILLRRSGRFGELIAS